MNNSKNVLPEDKVVIVVTIIVSVVSLLVTADLWLNEMVGLHIIFLIILMMNIAAMSVLTILYVLFYCNINIPNIASEFEHDKIAIKLKNYFVLPIIVGFIAIIFCVFVFLGGDYVSGGESIVITVFVGSVTYVLASTYRIAKLYPQLYHTNNRVNNMTK